MNSKEQIFKIIESANQAKALVQSLSSQEKNKILLAIGDQLEKDFSQISKANELDMKSAKEANARSELIERLALPPPGAAKKLFSDTAKVQDPLEEPIFSYSDKNVSFRYLNHSRDFRSVRKVRVPLGVIGMIYESRPSATGVAIAMALKAGNSLILKGGRDAQRTNQAFMDSVHKAFRDIGLPEGICQLVHDDENYTATYTLMKAAGKVDLMVIRGGKRTIGELRKAAEVPYVITGDGVVHAYVHDKESVKNAVNEIIFSKKGGASFCSCVETVLVSESAAETFFQEMGISAKKHGIELIGCEKSRHFLADMTPAGPGAWEVEHLAMKLSVRVVEGLEGAFEHINTFSSKHSESIFTVDEKIAAKFAETVDASFVIANGPTIFNGAILLGEGYPYHFGISTDKLHCRGILDLNSLTTTKYIVDSTPRGSNP